MKLAAIGNCSYQALIDHRGTIRWLCWPRFDSDFVFGSLLDPEAGEFSVLPASGRTRWDQRYLENTNVLSTTVHCDDGRYEVTDVAPRFEDQGRIVKPTMLIRRLRPLAGSPRVWVRCVPVFDDGRVAPSPALAGEQLMWKLGDYQLRLSSNVDLEALTGAHPLVLDRDIYLVLAIGNTITADIAPTCETHIEATADHWRRWIRRAHLPQQYRDATIRSALALKLHQYEDTGAITAATTTSIPEHPGSARNWDYRYCWIRDACFTAGALMRLGYVEELEGFANFMRPLMSSNDRALQPLYGIGRESELPERILGHLSGVDGSGPVRVGNAAFEQEQHDVYGELLAALCPFRDDDRLERILSDAAIAKLLSRIEHSLEVPDYGIWEKRSAPRPYTFSLLMHWVGANACARHCEGDMAERAANIAIRVRDVIETGAWCPTSGFYTESADELEHADASLFMMVNLGYLDHDIARATCHIDATAQRLRINDHLFRRYIHDDGLGETHAAFTVCGFWYAESLARIGRNEEARTVFESLLAHRNHVGLLSEDIDPDTGALWGNFPQTYSHVGIINTACALSASPSVIL